MILSALALFSTASAAPRFQPTSACSTVAKLGGQESRAFDFYAFAVMRAYDPSIPDRKGDSPARREAFLELCTTLPADTSVQKAMLALVEQHEATQVSDPPVELIQKLIRPLQGTDQDRVDFVNAHRPTPADVRAIFQEPVASALIAKLPEIFSGPVRGPQPDQTDTMILVVQTDDINRGEVDGLPGGYSRLRGKMNPGISMARFKFVQPGKSLGMAYDGLYQLDQKWVWIPKAWRLVEP